MLWQLALAIEAKATRPDSKPRFLEYLNKEEEDPFRKWQLDYVHRLRNQRRQEKSHEAEAQQACT